MVGCYAINCGGHAQNSSYHFWQSVIVDFSEETKNVTLMLPAVRQFCLVTTKGFSTA